MLTYRNSTQCCCSAAPGWTRQGEQDAPPQVPLSNAVPCCTSHKQGSGSTKPFHPIAIAFVT